MAVATLDPYRAEDALKAAGFDEAKTRAIISAAAVAHGDLATKSDIAAAVGNLRAELADRDIRLEGKISALDGKITDLSSDLNGKITDLSSDLNGKITDLSSDLNGKITRLEGKIGGLESKIDGLESKIDGKIDGLEGKMDGKINSAVVKAMGGGFVIACALFGAIFALSAAGVI